MLVGLLSEQSLLVAEVTLIDQSLPLLSQAKYLKYFCSNFLLISAALSLNLEWT